MQILTTSRHQPVLLDASTLMVGVHKQKIDNDFCFDNMKCIYLDALFNYFQDILIHETVWEELDKDRRDYITSDFLEKNVKIVRENDLYQSDPRYNVLFNTIAAFDLFRYRRMEKRNKGDVFSLAYAAHHNIPFLSTRDGSIIKAIEEIPSLSLVDVIGFEQILLLGYIQPNHGQPMKRFRSLYKSQCSPAINSKLIPDTFADFLRIQLPF